MKNVVKIAAIFCLLISITANNFLTAQAIGDDEIITFDGFLSKFISELPVSDTNEGQLSIVVYHNHSRKYEFSNEKDIDLILRKLKSLRYEDVPSGSKVLRVDASSLKDSLSIELNDKLNNEIGIGRGGEVYVNNINYIWTSSTPRIVGYIKDTGALTTLLAQLNVFNTEFLYYDESTRVSRSDCVTAIMKLIGVDEEAARRYEYININVYRPFDDLPFKNTNTGYIVLAKMSNVAQGVQENEYDYFHNFEPDRDVTVKECLTFMLRCLMDAEKVSWENVMEISVDIGLLNAEEIPKIDEEGALTGDMFATLLERMINMNRYLYWKTEDFKTGYVKQMQVDRTIGVKYIDWLLEKIDI